MRHAAILLTMGTLAMLAACDSREEAAPKPVATPDPTYASPREAEASLPDGLRTDYQRMLECEMATRIKAGRPAVIDTTTVVALTRRVKAGERAPDSCR